jgi:hypothetical protein
MNLRRIALEIGFKQKIPGGAESIPEDIDLDQLSKGMEDEMEHTDDPAVAMEIAIDHLKKNPNYYNEHED